EHQPLGPERQLFVRGPDGDDFTAVLSTWSNGIGPWEYGLTPQLVSQPLRGYLYTERPIYRPGQRVYFRGILRLDDDGAYSPPPPGTSLHVNANDPQGKLVFSGDFQTDAYGSVDGEIPLADGAPIGNYVLAARVGPVPGGLPP